MIRSRKAMTLCITLLCVNIAVIWGSSLLPGEVSGAISGWVKDLLDQLLNLPSDPSGTGHGLLRKLGHVSEFACLGACLGWLLSMLGKTPWLGILCGFPVACLDETIQCFVPDRGPSITDVCIDTAGLTLGCILLCAGFAIYQKRKNKKHS